MPSAVCSIVALCLVLASSAHAIPRLDIDVDTGLAGFQSSRVVTVGTVFDVGIYITGAVSLFAYDIKVDHDPAVLDATSAGEGAFLATAGPIFFVGDDSGNPVSAIATLLGVPTGASGDGTLFTIQYTALAKGDISLRFTRAGLVNDQMLAEAVDFGGARLVVQGVPLPSTLLLLGLGLVAVAVVRRG